MPIDDARILRDVAEALKWDERIDASDVDITAHEGVVTLDGTVTTAAEREAAIEDAYRVPGVRRVVAQVSVVPGTPRSDEVMAAELMASLAQDDRVDHRLLVVEVAGTIARLSGSVSTLAEKMAAEEDAWHTNGITRVVNEIVVIPLESKQDAEIEASLLAGLRADPRLSDWRHITVTSLDHRVYLRGTVRTLEERRAAEDIARHTAGVIEVHNQLVVGELPRESRAIRRSRL